MADMRFGIGQSVVRREDERFLTGHGRYLDDINFSGQLCAWVLRSPFAHADIVNLDISRAAACPGVAAILTGADLETDGVGDIPTGASVTCRNGRSNVVPRRPALAQGRVRHVGEAVAVVVADSIEQGRDASEQIEIDYAELPCVAATESALLDGVPQIHEIAPSNLCLDWDKGDRDATAAAFDRAERTVSLELVNSRVIVNPIEPRGCIGLWDSGSESFTLYNSGQAAHNIRRMLARDVLGIPIERLRVISPDVGGGFGTKNFVYPEQVLVLWAARRLQRPVKWTAQRVEGFVSDTQGRDHVMSAELAMTADGRFEALRISTIANVGAYVSTFGAMIPTSPVAVVLGGVYDIPHVYYNVKGVFTNTVPVDAYRGAGRPEASYAIERLVDAAAMELGVDVIELRRRNLIRSDAMPYATSMGSRVDCGDFEGILDEAIDKADWRGFPRRRHESEQSGKLRGIGIACYFEATLGVPNEKKEIRFDPDGGVTVLAGTMSNGQGHETTYAQIVHERLGIPLDVIRVVQGDTGRITSGGGHGGSRSMETGGNALVAAADVVVEKAREIAASHFESVVTDVEFVDGRCRVVGTDLSIGLLELAALARDPVHLQPGREPGLDATGTYAREANTYPNGCHIAELEIDLETGAVQMLRYTVVDDFGTLLNPMIVTGQIHGGIAQGMGQALLEQTVYDRESGQLLSGSLLDYCLPRATDVPPIDIDFRSVPTALNALGVKGCGEAGCIGSLPAVVNAVVDALRPIGVNHIDMPATPERVWAAIRRSTHSSPSLSGPST